MIMFISELAPEKLGKGSRASRRLFLFFRLDDSNRELIPCKATVQNRVCTAQTARALPWLAGNQDSGK